MRCSGASLAVVPHRLSQTQSQRAYGLCLRQPLFVTFDRLRPETENAFASSHYRSILRWEPHMMLCLIQAKIQGMLR